MNAEFAIDSEKMTIFMEMELFGLKYSIPVISMEAIDRKIKAASIGLLNLRRFINVLPESVT
jgi:hypothetical protein